MKLRLSLMCIAENHIVAADNDQWLVLNHCEPIAVLPEAEAVRMAKRLNAEQPHDSWGDK